MSRKVIIDPITRVEGHGRVSIHLDQQGKVEEARFHIVEFRGFERFIQGHPYWEAPLLVQRLCGICPVSHHLAAAKAIDQIVGVDPEDLPPAATKIRRLLHFAQILQSHALHFFYLASPDLLFGLEAPPGKRNVMQVAIEDRELARKGILMRKFGQELIKALAGKKIHGIAAVPGGVHKTFSQDERALFLLGTENLPAIDTIVQWSQEIIEFIKAYHEQHHTWLDTFAAYPSGHLGLVGPDGGLEFYDGRFRAIDQNGSVTLDGADTDYLRYFSEAVKPWSFLKFPYLKTLGPELGWNRVGPLARLNVCNHIPTPLAEQERSIFFASNPAPSHRTMHTHWARLIEILHCAESIQELLHDPELMSDELRTSGQARNEGIGVIEAPRGTLIHHYRVNDEGMITRCNLIVSTTHNNEAMNRAVKWVAEQVLNEQPEITESMLNQVEIAIRAYDPCLSCATHAMGKMPLQVELYDGNGELVERKLKN